MRDWGFIALVLLATPFGIALVWFFDKIGLTAWLFKRYEIREGKSI